MGRSYAGRVAGGGVRSLGRRYIRLELFPERARTAWVLKRRTRLGDSYTDQVLAHGELALAEGSDRPRDLIVDLRRIAFDLERQYRGSVDAGDPGAPTGGYGGQQALPGLESVSWARPVDGSALDNT